VRAPGRFSNELLWAVVDPVYVTPVDLHNMVLSDTHTFNPTTINEARFGWNSRNQTNSPRTQNGDWAKQLGIPNVSPVTFPDILNTGGGRYYNLGPGGLSERRGADFSFQENLTKIISKHTMKLGYEVIRTTYDSLVETFPSGRYVMGGTDFPFRPNTGNAFANFLLGNVSTATFTQAQAHWQPRWWSHSFYVQDDFKLSKNVQLNGGVRWDYQQSYGRGNFSYIKLNNWWDNLQPRLGVIWDFTGKGKGKVFVNYAKYIETPLPLDLNVRAGSDTTQTDLNFNVDTINAPAGSGVTADFGNLGGTHTPLDPGLKPQDVKEATGGFEYEVKRDLVVGVRGIYRYQGEVIEDGSFDDGNNYFIFNPGRRGDATHGATTEDFACQGDPANGRAPRCFGPARRYYRALEFTATKRFTNNWQLIASYVYSSLTGNYEGLFRNDNGQSDPNITSLFDLQSLLDRTYGHLPNDRPHQFKVDGSYRTPFKLLIGASFRAQSGIPFNQLTPHAVYGNNEGFGVTRGTAIVPAVTASQVGFPNVVNSIGSNRTPFTWNLDMNAYYPIKLGETKEIRFQADWFNVFNKQRAIRLDETFSINSGISGIPVNDPLNKLPNPFYGAGTIFQFPSSLRLGVKFTF